MVPVLSGKRARFVEVYLGEAQGDPAKAAALAGFDVPDRQGALLLRSTDVRAAIEARVNAAKPVDAIETARPAETSSSAAPTQTSRTPEQYEACDVLVLRTVHELTEHYRVHRPQVFEGFERFVPGATHEALKRFSPLRPSPTATAFKRLRAKRLVHVASYTRTPDGCDPERFPPGRSIFQLTQAGLKALRSLDDAQLANAFEVAAELLKSPERRRQLRAPG